MNEEPVVVPDGVVSEAVEATRKSEKRAFVVPAIDMLQMIPTPG